MLALPGKGVAASFVPGCYAAVADTAFVRDTARVVSTRLSAGTLVVDTTLMVSTTYVVDTGRQCPKFPTHSRCVP